MKKFFNYLLIATLLIGTAVSFNSCKDDDEEHSIIGTWKIPYEESWASGYYLRTYQSDGTLIMQDYELNRNDGNYKCYWTDSYTYSYKNNTVYEDYGDGETETINIQWVDNNHIVDDEGDHWYRQ